MRVTILINRNAGSLRTCDTDDFAAHVSKVFREGGHDADIRVITGKALSRELESAAADAMCEAICVCGGDGSISTAAGIAWRCGKILGVIPGGTMNLFARALKMPLDPYEAATAAAGASVRECDIASVNGRAFVHQFSIGLHPEMVAQRKRYGYSSRISKIMASVRGAFNAFRRSPRFVAEYAIDDGLTRRRTLGTFVCSNNPHGLGHLPYADRVDAGLLGVYIAPPLTPAQNMALAADIFLGEGPNNEMLEAMTGRHVSVVVLSASRRSKCAIDGELCPLPKQMAVRIHPGALKVLAPAPPQ